MLILVYHRISNVYINLNSRLFYSILFLIAFVAFGYGYHDDASFNISEKISLEKGSNTLDIISMMIGVQVTIFIFSSSYLPI